MDIKEIQRKIADNLYLIKSHAISHALKEGFDRKNMVEAIENGKIIENYVDEKRLLICGKTNISKIVKIYLHIVCEYADEVYLEIVTAYIPDEDWWENPPFKRRK